MSKGDWLIQAARGNHTTENTPELTPINKCESMESLQRRVGRLAMSQSLISDFPRAALSLMSKLIVVSAEVNFADQCIEYTALSPEFDIVPMGEVTPWYDVVGAHGGPEGGFLITFIKRPT